MKISERKAKIPLQWRLSFVIVFVMILVITVALDSLLNLGEVSRILWRVFGIVAVLVGFYFLFLVMRET